jgi:hypothetical protein
MEMIWYVKQEHVEEVNEKLKDYEQDNSQGYLEGSKNYVEYVFATMTMFVSNGKALTPAAAGIHFSRTGKMSPFTTKQFDENTRNGKLVPVWLDIG